MTCRAGISGGSGSATTMWNGAARSGLQCTVDPAALCATQSLSVTASDPTLGAASSPTKHYQKVTTVTTD